MFSFFNEKKKTQRMRNNFVMLNIDLSCRQRIVLSISFASNLSTYFLCVVLVLFVWHCANFFFCISQCKSADLQNLSANKHMLKLLYSCRFQHVIAFDVHWEYYLRILPKAFVYCLLENTIFFSSKPMLLYATHNLTIYNEIHEQQLPSKRLFSIG